MIPLIQNKSKEIQSTCKQLNVTELYLYGSALTPNFNESSDLDFAVSFHAKLSPIEQGTAFFSLIDALENLFNKKIDLLSCRVIKNPIFKEEIDRTKISVYAAA
jgi:predicted nucleotidyltransferase